MTLFKHYDWKRFDLELEEANPAKFPFLVWFMREMILLIGHIITGFVIGIAFVFIAFITINTVYKNPEMLKFWENMACAVRYHQSQ